MPDLKPSEQAALKALEHLEERMKTVSAESNTFATKYRFGGIVAIIALLNVDLLLDETVLNLTWSPDNWPTYIILAGMLIAVLVLGWFYFEAIKHRIERFNTAYRATKHKYELLLYGLLTGEEPKQLTLTLESDLEKAKMELPVPIEPDYGSLAAYLHDHHARKAPGGEADTLEAKMSLCFLVLAVVIKAFTYALMIL